MRQGGFTRCRLRRRFRAVFGTRRSCRPILGRPWGGRHLLTSSPQTELARKSALHHGEEVGYDITHGAALAACLQLVEYFLAMLRRQPPQGGLHVFLLICLGIAQARRQAHRLRCRIAVAFARAVRTFSFYTCTSYTYCPVQPSCGERVRSVAEQACCQRNRQTMAVGRLPRSPAMAASGANHRHRGIDRGPQWQRLRVPAPVLPECGRPATRSTWLFSWPIEACRSADRLASSAQACWKCRALS